MVSKTRSRRGESRRKSRRSLIRGANQNLMIRMPWAWARWIMATVSSSRGPRPWTRARGASTTSPGYRARRASPWSRGAIATSRVIPYRRAASTSSWLVAGSVMWVWISVMGHRALRGGGVENPADTSDVLGEVAVGTPEDVARAYERAARAYPAWRATPPPERGRVLARAAEIARRRLDDLARLLTREEGKVLGEARGEVLKGINLLEWYAGEGFRIGGKTRPSEMPDTLLWTLRQPLGVVAVITPWNFPWAEPVWKAAPALVAGNCVLLKPASLTPLMAQAFADVLREAGLPEDVLTVVVGAGSDVGDALVAHPEIRAVSFTGSYEVGREVYARAARRLAKVCCEMGGKNAVVVMPDADLDLAVAGIAQGAFGSTGQRCTATSLCVVHQEVARRVVEGVVDRARALRVGNGLEEGVSMGPLVDERQLRTVLDYIALGQKEGARLV